MDDAAAERERLAAAFAAFNSASDHLIGHYRALERRVAALTRELRRAQDARLRELKEKERLADRLVGILAALPGGVLVFDAEDRLVEFNAAAESLLGGPLAGSDWRSIAQRCLARGVLRNGEVQLADGRKVNLAIQAMPEGRGRVVLLSDVTASRALLEGWQQRERLQELGAMLARLAHQLRHAAGRGAVAARPPAAALGGGRCARAAGLAGGAGRPAGDAAQPRRPVVLCPGHAPGAGRRAPGRPAVCRAAGGAERLPDLAGDVGGRGPAAAAGAGDGPHLSGRRPAQSARQCLAGRRAAGLDPRQGRRGEADSAGRGRRAGVAPAAAERIFEAFYTTRPGGTGLGLAIVRSVVEMHGGRVRLCAPGGGGACFELELPWPAEPPVLLPSATPLQRAGGATR
ncbi:MAG: hypothetical protein KatS3mg121_1443 [Gammaproteobacteria bacterium]|nr:MAG: hypothetical protein KatS3mg121_1443 [Gammaproteobacteria bacterium]